MTTPLKSSFLQRRISKEDAIIQIFRPVLGNKIGQALDVFDRMVAEAEMLTNLGTKLQAGKTGGEPFFVTPEDLRANLDEYQELEQIANEGRKFLDALGYVSPRKGTPIAEGTAPVGKTVDVTPLTMTLPGSEPVTGVVLTPKAPAKK